MRQLIDSGRIEAGCCVLQVQWEGKALDPLGSLSPEGAITTSIGDDAPITCGLPLPQRADHCAPWQCPPLLAQAKGRASI